MNRVVNCPNALLLADRQLAADLFGATRNQTVSDLGGNAVSNLTGGAIDPTLGKHVFHAAVGAGAGAVVAQACGLDPKVGGLVGAIVGVFGLPWLGSLPGNC